MDEVCRDCYRASRQISFVGRFDAFLLTIKEALSWLESLYPSMKNANMKLGISGIVLRPMSAWANVISENCP